MKNHCVPYDEFVMRNLLCSLCMAPCVPCTLFGPNCASANILEAEKKTEENQLKMLKLQVRYPISGVAVRVLLIDDFETS